MKSWILPKRQRTAGKLAAGLMLALWLATFALAASPQLHRLLHQDSQSLNHHCLITQVQQQLLVGGFVVLVTATPPVADLDPGCHTDFCLVPTCYYRLSPSRAPPFAGFLLQA